MPTVNELSHEAPPLGRSERTPREFDILDVALIFAARKWTILIASAAGFILALLLVLTVAPTFTAKAVILPPQQEQSTASALFGQLGALASLSGMGGSLKNPTDLYIGLLGSQSVTDAMVKRFDLIRLYHPKRFSDARLMIQKAVKFVANKDGTISISVSDRDPRKAATMADRKSTRLNSSH